MGIYEVYMWLVILIVVSVAWFLIHEIEYESDLDYYSWDDTDHPDTGKNGASLETEEHKNADV